MTQIDVLVFAPSYPPAFRAGGPARTLEALVKQAPENFLSWVIAPNRDLGVKDALDVPTWRWVQQARAKVKYIEKSRLLGTILTFIETRTLKPRIVYLNSFSDPVFSLLPLVFFGFGVWKQSVLVLAPRGEMDAQALESRRQLKRFIISALKLTGMHHKIVWHASNEREATQIRKIWGSEIDLVIREDEVSLPSVAEPPILNSGRIQFGYVGRIVPNKGLLEAVEAVTQLTQKVEFTIIGPAEDDAYYNRCERLARAAPQNCKIVFAGALSPESVRRSFANFDAFIFPTQFENFGHVIAESLSMSCPVFAPDTTPWTDELRDGGGFVLNSGNQSLSELLDEFASLSPEHRFELRVKAGQTFNQWRTRRDALHVFEQALGDGK